MAKKESFGTASVKRLSSITIAGMLMTGCASPVNSVDALKAWDSQFEYCADLAQNNKRPFPANEWFNQLSVEDKKTVVGYLYNYNDRLCMDSVNKQLKMALERDGNNALLKMFSIDLTPLDKLAHDRIKHLDKAKILKLQASYSLPFNLRFVIEEQNLKP